ncbi:phosphatase [uncultured Bacteroides sp.]|uniref:phosphatase n=1 Tax=uncultured Bacteroides sp. TaxID=162156 RepID=UPI002AAB55E0|nr:phosphatase [uncultured Bacteroides sp.]
MKEIHLNLYISPQDDYENIVKHQDGCFIIHACKEPYHRKALGYVGRSKPKDHPEYLIAYRENHLILNLVDIPDPAYISKEIINEAIKAIGLNIVDKKVLVHWNQGISRSATIGLLYLHHIGIISTNNFKEAKDEFLKLYPNCNPENGMRIFARQNWSYYQK